MVIWFRSQRHSNNNVNCSLVTSEAIELRGLLRVCLCRVSGFHTGFFAGGGEVIVKVVVVYVSY